MQKILDALAKEREMIVFEEIQKAEAAVAQRIKESVSKIVMRIQQEVQFERRENALIITVIFKEGDQP